MNGGHIISICTVRCGLHAQFASPHPTTCFRKPGVSPYHVFVSRPLTPPPFQRPLSKSRPTHME